MKPLARWTIGPVTNAGIECLEHSVRHFKQIYPEFDRVICCNNIKIYSEYADVIEQDPNSLPFPPLEDNWKFYPPRLRISAKELFIDNDLIITKRLQSIDQFLKSNEVLATEGLRQNFGIFNEKLKHQEPVNAGLIGLPEGLDLNQVIIDNISKWETRFDNQGIVVLAAKELLISREVGLYLPENEINWNKPAHHFLRLNVTEDHKAWKEFIARIQRSII